MTRQTRSSTTNSTTTTSTSTFTASTPVTRRQLKLKQQEELEKNTTTTATTTNNKNNINHSNKNTSKNNKILSNKKSEKNLNSIPKNHEKEEAEKQIHQPDKEKQEKFEEKQNDERKENSLLNENEKETVETIKPIENETQPEPMQQDTTTVPTVTLAETTDTTTNNKANNKEQTKSNSTEETSKQLTDEIIVQRQEILIDTKISQSIKDKLDVKMSFENEDENHMNGHSSDEDEEHDFTDDDHSESGDEPMPEQISDENQENKDGTNPQTAGNKQKKGEHEKLRRRLPVSIKELIDYHSSNGKSIKEIVNRINMVCRPEEKVSYGYVQKYLYRKKLEATTAKKARYYRKKYGFVYRRMRRKPVLTDSHRQSRIQWCQAHVDDKFDQDIFIGKTSLKPFLASLNQLKGQPQDPNQPRQQTTLHLWGAISRKGASPLQIFDGALTTAMYLEILLENVVPFIAENFPEGHRFHQDNNPKHSAKLSQEFLESTGINWVKSPPRSHDLNPIELVWTDLIQNVSKRLPKTLGQVVVAVKDYWKTLTPEKCSEFIDKLCNIVPKVLEKNGEWVSLS